MKSKTEELRQRCNITKKIAPDKIDKELYSILNSIGMMTCIKASGDLWMVDSLRGRMGLTDAEVKQLKKGGIGCEPLRVLAETNIRSTEVIKCMIEEFTTDVKVGGATFQSVDICSEGIMCCQPNVTQGSRLKIISESSVPDDVIVAIGQQIRDDVQEALVKISDKKNDPELVGKYVENVIKKINEREAITQQNHMNTSILTNTFASQGICLRLKNGSCLAADSCDIQQDIGIRLLAQNIVQYNTDEIIGLPGMGDFFADSKGVSLGIINSPKLDINMIRILRTLVIIITIMITLAALHVIMYLCMPFHKAHYQSTILLVGLIIVLCVTAVSIGVAGWGVCNDMEGSVPHLGKSTTDGETIPACCLCKADNCKTYSQTMIAKAKQRATQRIQPSRSMFMQASNRLSQVALYKTSDNGGLCKPCGDDM